MKKIFESEPNNLGSNGESADSLIIFEFENEDEIERANEINDLKDYSEARTEWENWTELYNEWWPMPGSMFNRFNFRLCSPFLIVSVYTAYNI